jgi:hypothetical protein
MASFSFNAYTDIKNQVTGKYARDGKGLMATNFAPSAQECAGGMLVGDLPITAAMEQAGCLFELSTAVMKANGFDVPGGKAICRADTGQPLNAQSATYTPMSNHWMLEVMGAFPGLQHDNILSIGGGRQTYLTATLTDATIGDHPVRRQLLLFNSTDGKISLGVGVFDTMLFCANQFSRIMESGIKIKHTRNVALRTAEIPALLSAQDEAFRVQCKSMEPLLNIRPSEDTARAVLKEIYHAQLAKPYRDRVSASNPNPIERERILEDLPCYSTIQRFWRGGAIAAEAGTAYGLLQAVTQWETHEAGRLADPLKAQAVRLNSLYHGDGGSRVEAARQAVLALV